MARRCCISAAAAVAADDDDTDTALDNMLINIYLLIMN